MKSDGPLDGFVVGVTADRRAHEQAELLRRRGAEVLFGPAIATAYLASDDALRAATVALVERPPAYLAATTGIGIRAWFEAAQVWGLGDRLLDALRETRIVARGPKATATVQAAGLDVWRSAANEQMDQLLAHLLSEPLAGACVAVQLYGMPAPEITTALTAAGAEVLEVPVYQWRTPDDPAPALRLAQAAIDGRVHAVTFTAAPAVMNLLALASAAGIDHPLLEAFNRKGVVAACVGPVCARGALAAGILAPVVPDVGRLGLMVRALSDRLLCDRRTVPMAGVDVVLQGLLAVVGEERVRLNLPGEGAARHPRHQARHGVLPARAREGGVALDRRRPPRRRGRHRPPAPPPRPGRRRPGRRPRAGVPARAMKLATRSVATTLIVTPTGAHRSEHGASASRTGRCPRRSGARDRGLRCRGAGRGRDVVIGGHDVNH